MSNIKVFTKETWLILMVGDGLNDAPSIALSDVSISHSNASDLTKNAADIVFQGDKLYPILKIISTAIKAKN